MDEQYVNHKRLLANSIVKKITKTNLSIHHLSGFLSYIFKKTEKEIIKKNKKMKIRLKCKRSELCADCIFNDDCQLTIHLEKHDKLNR